MQRLVNIVRSDHQITSVLVCCILRTYSVHAVWSNRLITQ